MSNATEKPSLPIGRPECTCAEDGHKKAVAQAKEAAARGTEIRKILLNILSGWQNRLGLGAWTFNVSIEDRRNIRQGIAHVDYDVFQQAARICICHPEEYEHPCEDFIEYDLEWVILHELLHIRLEPITRGYEDGSSASEQEEVIINQIARAFLSMRRFGPAPAVLTRMLTGEEGGGCGEVH